MVMGRVVTYDALSNTYYLPAEHAAALTRPAAPNNFAAFMQYIPLLGGIEDGIIVSIYQNLRSRQRRHLCQLAGLAPTTSSGGVGGCATRSVLRIAIMTVA
jgi:hypothetical protein